MIYVTGDIHGEIDIHKLSNKNWNEAKNLTKDDYLIIMGDFGLPFFNHDIQENGSPAPTAYSFWIRWLSEKPYTILWVDGNHENFNFWDKQKVTEWHGGKVQIHPHAKNVIHLMRGEIYEIEGKTFFAFGGAMSHDKHLRKVNETWWQREEADASEMQNALDNLGRYGNKVDYILTHTIPKSIVENFFHFRNTSYTEKFLNLIMDSVEYQLWFAGHFHVSTYFPDNQLMVLYRKILSLDECNRILNDELTLNEG